MAKFQTYQYPLNDEEYKGKIRFTAYEEISDVSQTISELVDSTKKDIAKLSAEETAARDAGDLELAQSKVNQRNELSNSLASFEGTNDTSNTKQNKRTNVGEVLLYLPPGLTFADGVAYENFDLGATGAAVESGMGIAKSMTAGVSSFVNAISGNGANAADLGKLAAVQAASKFGSFTDELKGGLKMKGGVTMNPNTRVLFKQVNMRTFAFTFKLVAKSAQEYEEIKKIVGFFREQLYPEDIPVTIGDGVRISLGYKFPNKFKLNIEYDGKNIAHKIKPCHLVDVTTTYNEGGMGMRADGSFTEVSIALNFQETVALTKKDIKEGF